MGKIIRRVVAVLLAVCAIIIAVLPSGDASATTTHGEYEYDGNTLVKYLGDSSEVTLPNWITKVGKEAFANNKNITKVVLLESVKEIDYSAFEGCINLETVVIPESVRAIGSSAFSGCKNLINISLPSRIKSLGSGVFAGCIGLSELYLPEDNREYMSDEGVIYTKDSERLVQYLAGRPYTSYTMPDSVNTLGEYAFWGANELTDVKISPNVKRIPEYAFANCHGLKKIILPDSVETISAFAFSDCSNLEYINVPDTVGFIDDRAFYMSDGTKIRFVDKNGDVVKEYNATEVDKYGDGKNDSNATNDISTGNRVAAFTQQMTNVQAPNENNDYETDYENDNKDNQLYNPSYSGDEGWISEISDKDYSTNSDSSEIGSTKIIGGNAVVMFPTSMPITSGYDLEKAEEEDEYASTSGFIADKEDALYDVSDNIFSKYKGKDSVVDIPDGVSEIGNRAFYKNIYISGVNFPSSINSIDDFAFARSSISSVNIPNGVKTIGYGAFYNCFNLENIDIPNSVNDISLGAFSGTKWLSDFKENSDNKDFLIVGDGILISYRGKSAVVDIPTNVKKVGAGAFLDNKNIMSVTIPGTVTEIGEEAFNNCTNLTSVILNEGLVQINDRAFKNTNLSAVSIPDSVRGIGIGAFDMEGDESSLKCVLIKGKDVPDVTFNNTASRLSAKDLRSRVFDGVESLIIEADCDIDSGSLLNPIGYGYAGQIFSIDLNNNNSLILERATVLPDITGTVSIDPRAYIGKECYIMDNVKDNAFDFYEYWYEWSDIKPTGISINGNTSNELDELLQEISQNVGAEAVILPEGINVILDGDCFGDNYYGFGNIIDNNDTFILEVSQSREYIDLLKKAYYECFGKYPYESSVYLDMNLFDKSHTIPIHKVGNNKVEVVIPLPESLKGNNNVKIGCLDDNHMFTELSSEIINEDNIEAIRFVTSHFSPYLIYTKTYNSQSDSVESTDNNVEFGVEYNINDDANYTLSNKNDYDYGIVNTLNKEVVRGISMRWVISAILIIAAVVLVLFKPIANRIKRKH